MSRATWLTTVQTTSKGREQSDLIHNIAHCVADHCWKRAKQPDEQHYLQLYRPLLKESVADWLQHKLNNTELVEGLRRARGPDENLVHLIPSQTNMQLGFCNISNSFFNTTTFSCLSYLKSYLLFAKNKDTFVLVCTLLLYVNSAIAN